MGRGRAPCCDKSKVKRGPWSPAEDLRLITFIQKHGHGNWRSLPKQAGLLRCGKSCRLRWINYLRPDVKRGNFNKEEQETIIKLHQSLGNKWSKIASYLPGRTDNEIKNVWNTHLKKRVVKKDKDGETKEFSRMTSSSSRSSSTSSLMSSYGNEDIGEGLKDQGGLAKTRPDHEVLCKEKKQDEPKEASTTTSSISSYASDYSNSGGVIDDPMPKEEVGSLFNFGGPCEFDKAAYEVIKNNQISGVNSDDQVIEIPLESDIDFWDMLDNLDYTVQSSECQQPQEFEASQSSNFGKECEHREIECREWLKHLEMELGLEATSDGGHNSAKEVAAGQLGIEKMMMKTLRTEIDHAKCYFPTWPSPSQNFGI